MRWRHNSKFFATSACDRYEVAGGYADGHFSWRGRFVPTDELVQASADRGFVETCCDRHEASLAHEDAIGGRP